MKSLISKSELPLEPGLVRDAEPSEVARRARLVLEVAPGERRLLPGFGCRIHGLELDSRESLAIAGALLEEALEHWAPELCVDEALVTGCEEGKVHLRLLSAGAWHTLTISHRRAAPPSSVRDAEAAP